VRFAYADPPYPGTAHNYPERQEVDHIKLLRRLQDYDGWLLHTNAQSLPLLAPLVPVGTRFLAWGKYDGLPVTKAGLVYTWEPILMWPIRKPAVWVRDSLWADIADHRERITMRGGKPLQVARWLFLAAGLEPSDELDDLYPGSGAIARAWDQFVRQGELAI
jgi:hypothetical protein